MKKTILLTSMSVMLASILGACGMNNKDQNLGREARNNMTEVNYDNRADRDNNRMDVGTDNNNQGVNDYDRIDVAEKAADRVTDLKGVEDATVIVTDSNAYVAANLEENQELTNDLEDRIGKAVRKADPSVNDVFVSTNPDFLDRMNGWADQIRNGNPVSGFAKEFGETVRRVFPDNR
jgi:spore cortex protein